MSKGGSKQTTVQKADPWKGVQEPLRQMYAQAGEAAQDTVPFYPHRTFAGFDPTQSAGMQSALGYATGTMAPGVADYQQTLTGMMQAPQNITQDPAVLNMMAANEAAVMGNLQRNVLPTLGRGATAAGQYGGSRQGIAEGIAAGDASKALAQANAQTALGAYDTASRTAAAAGGMMPGALQMGYQPSQTMMDVGGMRQQMGQRAIDEAMQRHYYPQQSERDTLSWLNSILSGAGQYAGSSTTAPGPDPMANALGGAMLGGQMFGSGLGALGGALMFSDRRLKTNVTQIGQMNGHNLYSYNYVWGGPRQVGVMAQEVMETNPGAVTDVGGFLAVDYGRL